MAGLCKTKHFCPRKPFGPSKYNYMDIAYGCAYNMIQIQQPINAKQSGKTQALTPYPFEFQAKRSICNTKIAQGAHTDQHIEE